MDSACLEDVSHPEAVRVLAENPNMTLIEYIDLHRELTEQDKEDVEELVLSAIKKNS